MRGNNPLGALLDLLMSGGSPDPFDGIDSVAVGIDIRVALPYEIRQRIVDTTGLRDWELEENRSHNVTVRFEAPAASLDTLEPMLRYHVYDGIERLMTTVTNGQRAHRKAQAVVVETAQDEPDPFALVLDSSGPMADDMSDDIDALAPDEIRQ